MFSIQADATNLIANLETMKKELLLQIEASAERSMNILVQAIREDLERKILRPRESGGELSDAIDGEVVRNEGDLIIGVGDTEKMNTEVPYWRLQDQGGPIAVDAVPGFFVGPSGQRVPFDQGRAPATQSTPHGFMPTRFSQDVFVYDKKGSSIMWIKNDVKPKRYFEGGEHVARPKVMAEFEKALRRALG